MSYTRIDNRTLDQIRNTKITPNFSPVCRRLGADRSRQHESHLHGDGRRTRSAVSAKQRERLGDGGIRDAAARDQYARTNRETQRPSGRTQEIQRLIGRSLRAVVDTKLLASARFSSTAT
jgi:hypothetical protein